MRQVDYGPGWMSRRGIRGIAGGSLNIFLVLTGIFFLTAGTYVSIVLLSISILSCQT